MKSLGKIAPATGFLRRWLWCLVLLHAALLFTATVEAGTSGSVPVRANINDDVTNAEDRDEGADLRCPSISKERVPNGQGDLQQDDTHWFDVDSESSRDPDFGLRLRPLDYCPPWHDRLWVRTECILWWTESLKLPALVTSSIPGTAVDNAGVLDQFGTMVLFGNQGAASGVHTGGRISFGCWLDACQCDGVEAAYFGMGGAATQFSTSNNDTPIIARPFFDTVGNQQAAMLVAYPGLMSGSIAVDASTELQSVEVLWRHSLYACSLDRVDFVAGYRFARLDENVHVSQFSEWTTSQGFIAAGTTKQLFDDFSTKNQFHGGEIGFVYQSQFRRWSLETSMKLAIGNMSSLVRISGATQTTVPGSGTATFSGGLLAQDTNIGSYERNELAVLPELGTTLGYNLTPRLRATVGYTLLCLTNVARPDKQIDTEVTQLPPETPTGSHNPQFWYSKSSLWAQGLNLGLDYRF